MFALIKFRLPQSQIANVEEDPGDAEISPKVLDWLAMKHSEESW